MLPFTHGWAGNFCADHHRNLQIHHWVRLFRAGAGSCHQEMQIRAGEKLGESAAFLHHFSKAGLYSELPYSCLTQTRAFSSGIFLWSFPEQLCCPCCLPGMGFLSHTSHGSGLVFPDLTRPQWGLSQFPEVSWTHQLLSCGVGLGNFYGLSHLVAQDLREFYY